LKPNNLLVSNDANASLGGGSSVASELTYLTHVGYLAGIVNPSLSLSAKRLNL